jgi:hypothetical protein
VPIYFPAYHCLRDLAKERSAMSDRNQGQFLSTVADDSVPHRGESVESLREALASGLTVRDVAKRYRVGPDKVRAWIRRGELRAVNTASALCGRPRWVIPPDALPVFERRRAGGVPKAFPKRRRRQNAIDFYP